MAAYAGMIDRVDQKIGDLVSTLKESGDLENTLILFLSDNGACAESPRVENADPEAPMGTVGSYESYGQNWATVVMCRLGFCWEPLAWGKC